MLGAKMLLNRLPVFAAAAADLELRDPVERLHGGGQHHEAGREGEPPAVPLAEVLRHQHDLGHALGNEEDGLDQHEGDGERAVGGAHPGLVVLLTDLEVTLPAGQQNVVHP